MIPTYEPDELTGKLVEDIVRWNPEVLVYVVDDCTPQDRTESIEVIRKIAASSGKITVLRTPSNTLKAGALNYALKHIFARKNTNAPDVILTLDDDIVITSSTVRNLVTELMTYDHLGAVCSQCRVLNKNKNLMTRLQGLEYLGFNATRLADEGFFRGPLVMHGMLAAFRVSALEEVGGFAEGHLIEDYEITTRLKSCGWSVKSAVSAHAWTIVPENFSKLWRQRTRWSYGGLTVVDGVKYLPSVLQDLIGHGMFWATILMIDLLVVSVVFSSSGYVPPQIPGWIIALSLFQLAIWHVFQLWLMRMYKEKDVYDWIIRISILPEFIYINVLTFILMGSYFFFFFNILTHSVTEKSSVFSRRVVNIGHTLFRVFGYSKHWGTRPKTIYVQF